VERGRFQIRRFFIEFTGGKLVLGTPINTSAVIKKMHEQKILNGPSPKLA
jgi:hypothetical protein